MTRLRVRGHRPLPFRRLGAAADMPRLAHEHFVEHRARRGNSLGTRTTKLRVALVATFACTMAQFLAPGPAAAQLARLAPSTAGRPQAMWTRIAGPPGTGCAHDSSFAFFVHIGDPLRVMVFFEGGGGCWNGVNCNLEGRATFDPRVDSTDHPTRFGGLLALANPANPVRDYSVVFVPYCTGDVHLGSRDVTYVDTLPTRETPHIYSVRHQGARNVAAAIAWVTAHWPRPAIVFVTGASAGAIPTPLYAMQLARRYPNARVVQLGDGAGGFRANAIPALLAHWGATEMLRRDPAFRSLDSSAFNFESLYLVAARTTPRVRLAQINFAEDETQRGYLRMLGVHDVPLQDLLRDNLTEIRRVHPTFRAYTIPGDGHTVLQRPAFYTLSVDGVAMRDWVAALLEGGTVHDIGEGLLRSSPSRPSPANPDPDDDEDRRPSPLLLHDLWNHLTAVTSIHAERPDLVRKHTAFLEQRWRGHQALATRFQPGTPIALTPEQLERLRTLGYIR